MTLYRTKPQTIEAVQWHGDNETDIVSLFPQGTRFMWSKYEFTAYPPGGGRFHANRLDWVVLVGVFYDRWPNSNFLQVFERVEPEPESDGSD